MTPRSYFGKMNSTLGSVVPLAMFFYRVGWWDQFCFCLFFLCIFCRKCVQKRFCYLCNLFWYLNPTIAQKSQKYHFVIRGAITFRTSSIFSAVLWWPSTIDNFSFSLFSTVFAFFCRVRFAATKARDRSWLLHFIQKSAARVSGHVSPFYKIYKIFRYRGSFVNCTL